LASQPQAGFKLNLTDRSSARLSGTGTGTDDDDRDAGLAVADADASADVGLGVDLQFDTGATGSVDAELDDEDVVEMAEQAAVESVPHVFVWIGDEFPVPDAFDCDPETFSAYVARDFVEKQQIKHYIAHYEHQGEESDDWWDGFASNG